MIVLLLRHLKKLKDSDQVETTLHILEQGIPWKHFAYPTIPYPHIINDREKRMEDANRNRFKSHFPTTPALEEKANALDKNVKHLTEKLEDLRKE